MIIQDVNKRGERFESYLVEQLVAWKMDFPMQR